jgi:uncharacterized membrane protein
MKKNRKKVVIGIIIFIIGLIAALMIGSYQVMMLNQGVYGPPKP